MNFEVTQHDHLTEVFLGVFLVASLAQSAVQLCAWVEFSLFWYFILIGRNGAFAPLCANVGRKSTFPDQS